MKKKLLNLSLSLALSGLFLALALLPVRAADGTRDTLTVTTVARSGTVETSEALDGDGHAFNNNGETWVKITNNYTGSIVATFVTPGTVDGLALADLDVTLTTGQVKLIGPFQPGRFNQSDGSVYLNWTTTSNFTTISPTLELSVTLDAFRLE